MFRLAKAESNRAFGGGAGENAGTVDAHRVAFHEQGRMTTDTETDFNGLLQINLVRVFSERDPDLRLEAIAEIYASDAVLYEPGHVATGHAQIAQAVDTLLANLPPQFVFSSDGPAVGHHGVARLRWSGGPPDQPAVVTGTDVAQVVEGRIQTLHVFLDPAQS